MTQTGSVQAEIHKNLLYLKLVGGSSMSTKLQGSLGVVFMVQHVVAQCTSQAGASSVFAQVQLV